MTYAWCIGLLCFLAALAAREERSDPNGERIKRAEEYRRSLPKNRKRVG